MTLFILSDLLTDLNLPFTFCNWLQNQALTVAGSVAQRLERQTHNAHEAILHGRARERSVVKIAGTYRLFARFSRPPGRARRRAEPKAQLAPELTPD